MVQAWVKFALACAIVLASEVIDFAPRADLPPGGLAGTPASLMTAKTATQQHPSPKTVDETVVAILARPLFSPARRPQAPSVVQAGLPRLSGILSGPGGNYAIFQPVGAPRSITAGAGAALGGWTVQAITTGGVILTRRNERLVLHPTFANVTADLLPAANRARDQWGRHYQPRSYLERHG
jgi:hypothetical protein